MKSMFEKMGGSCRRDGDHLPPNLDLSPQDKALSFGMYGHMRLSFLKEHRNAEYNRLIIAGKMAEHLSEVDRRARERVELIVSDMAKADGTDEALKARDQMRWVGLMNNYRSCALEIVLADVVYK